MMLLQKQFTFSFSVSQTTQYPRLSQYLLQPRCLYSSLLLPDFVLRNITNCKNKAVTRQFSTIVLRYIFIRLSYQLTKLTIISILILFKYFSTNTVVLNRRYTFTSFSKKINLHNYYQIN